MAERKGLFRLVTVNTMPERAFRLIGVLTEALKDEYDITHVDNCASMDEVIPKVTEHKPNLLFCAPMWTPEEAEEIQRRARSIVPGIKTHTIPTGLQGPEDIVEYLLNNVPPLLDS